MFNSGSPSPLTKSLCQKLQTTLLPIQVRIATCDEDFEGLCRVRSAAYGRHRYTDGVSENLSVIDDNDRNSVLLIAEEKETGSIIGTIRVNSSLRGKVSILPSMGISELGGASFVYLDRFATAKHPLAEVAALALIKAEWFHCYHEGVIWVIAAALPALRLRYQAVGLRPLNGPDTTFEVPQLHALKYTAMGERLRGLQANLLSHSPALCPFFLEQYHPDILIPMPEELAVALVAPVAY